MLDLMGSGYVIEHCISAFQHDMEEKQYRTYLTDTLRLIGENVAALSHGSYIANRWIDTKKKEQNEEKSADEIAADIIRRAGLKLKGGNEC